MWFSLQSCAHGDQHVDDLEVSALSHKGKATSDITFREDDPPEEYSNPTIQPRVTGYTMMARQIHGSEFDPRTEPLSSEVVMRMGGGKKHDRYYVGGSLLNPAEVPTLPQVKARISSSSSAVQERPTASQTLLETVLVSNVICDTKIPICLLCILMF